MDSKALTLCGTYTLDPLVEVIDYWNDFLELGLAVQVAPYAQLFQQLLDPASDLRANRGGANAVLLRWTDLLPRHAATQGAGPAWNEVAPCVAEVATALASFSHRVPCLVLVGPSDHTEPVFERALRELQGRLSGTPNLFVDSGDIAMQRYGVGNIHDPSTDRLGHIPFTLEAIAALGTTLARWYAALARRPVKIVAVDADNTLWAGAVGEEGLDGIEIDASHKEWQGSLVEQSDAGRLLCMLSKNDEQDVRLVFAARPEMPLQWSHLVATRIDWQPKPENLREMVATLGLSLDGVVFLDDSPVECAEMRARCPAVTTVRVPEASSQLGCFAQHLWPLDKVIVTDEDRARTRMYLEDASRAHLREGVDSLQGFLDGLELDIEIEPPSLTQVPRLAQLSHRTNQFNASLIRLDEQQVRDDLTASGETYYQFVQARDRFGDYGIVGQVRAHARNNCLAVDLFMLSCRALGRGIEHRMIATAGRHAVSLGLEEIAVLFRHGERNAPARRFLETVFDTAAQGDETWFRMAAGRAAAVVFDATRVDCASDASVADPAQPLAASFETVDMGARYEFIAHELTTAARIRAAMASRVRPRSNLSTEFIAPAPGLETEIALIWQRVLRVDRVGSHDRFQDLGGKSVHLVQVHSLLRSHLEVEVEITTLFQHATVSSLAEHLGSVRDVTVVEAARQRGVRMREAHARAASRPRVSA